MVSYKVYAVDFDGTLFEDKFPEIGKPIMKTIDFVKKKKAKGEKIILWTCREGENLEKALAKCKQYGLVFDAVNDNLEERKQLYNNNCRKIGADYYLDDKSMKLEDIY